jgi:hypothetical protein
MFNVNYQYVGDYSPNILRFQLLCDGQVLQDHGIAKFFGGSYEGNLFQVMLPRPCAYELRLFDYWADRKGGDWTAYTVEVDHPK